MNLRLIVTIFLIAAAPICAQAQKPTPAKVTKTDAQKVLKIISGDKAKTRIYCEMAKFGDQMEHANETGDTKKFDALFQILAMHGDDYDKVHMTYTKVLCAIKLFVTTNTVSQVCGA